mmetsp:Transcript_3916/g.4541  ORF Transcript_3916/g.4541 Transcript_3916/m.4541 type:complete len:500 (-) Transcript_3916:368-1867(-)|eukprot:CAMPEP_0185776004 /NCGR_PEP_ID=MMETSP1174-20130828/84055_1 /TAXON_ID=35687 /ORGANISM="Dictyocha speculum, Strain CCMP1381" /LENGTH=499 /DNA_ID=CAMNT_0028463769 /DNA_START=64 /DNA_END=1563 /DNA_ORIENTATION=+
MSLLLGVALGLSGSIFINVGNNIQSTAMHKLEVEIMKKQAESGQAAELHPTIEPSESKLWIFGTCMFVGGSVLNFLSYAHAPQCVLASLESIQFVTNVLYAKFVTGSLISWKMTFGVGVTVFGCITAVLFAPAAGKVICSAEDMITLFYDPDSPKHTYAWEAYMCIAISVSVSLHFLYGYYDKMERANTPLPNSNFVMMIQFSVLAAVGFGTSQVVLAKMLGYFTSLTIFNTDPDCIDEELFKTWFPYVVIPVWGLLVSQWLVRLNKGLERFDPIQFLPIIQGNFILWSIVSGAICFQEFVVMESASIKTTEGLTWLGFICGVIVMFYGLFLICSDSGGEEDQTKLIEERERSDSKQSSASGSTGSRPSMHKQNSRRPPMDRRNSQPAKLSDLSRFFTVGAAQMTEQKYLQEKIKIHEDLCAKLGAKTISKEDADQVKAEMIKMVSQEKQKEKELSERKAKEEAELGSADDLEAGESPPAEKERSNTQISASEGDISAV